MDLSQWSEKMANQVPEFNFQSIAKGRQANDQKKMTNQVPEFYFQSIAKGRQVNSH